MRFVSSYAKETGFPPARTQEIELAAEEALVNVCKYAYPQEIGDVELIEKVIDALADLPVRQTAALQTITDILAYRPVGEESVVLGQVSNLTTARLGAGNILIPDVNMTGVDFV